MRSFTSWSKSSYSGHSGSCVEVAGAPGVVGVRDTKDRGGGTLVFGERAWQSFVGALKSRAED